MTNTVKLKQLLNWFQERKLSAFISDNQFGMRCLFHEEQTPSMVIKGDKYFCFSCGAKGSIHDIEIDLKEAE